MYSSLKLVLPEACDRGLLLVLLSYLLFHNSTSTLNKKTYHLPTWNVTRALPQVQKLCGKQRNNLQQCISYLLKSCISNKTHFLCLSAYIFFDQGYVSFALKHDCDTPEIHPLQLFKLRQKFFRCHLQV